MEDRGRERQEPCGRGGAGHRVRNNGSAGGLEPRERRSNVETMGVVYLGLDGPWSYSYSEYCATGVVFLCVCVV